MEIVMPHNELILRSEIQQLRYSLYHTNEEIEQMKQQIIDLQSRLAYTEKERDDLQDMINDMPGNEHDEY